ncbi:MAG: flavin oxidoreductase/NADH oxidase [Eubacteriales bacterium]
MDFEKFNYKSLDDIKDKLNELGVTLPLSENIGALFNPITVEGHTLKNRIAVQPMEGCDSTYDGSPQELTHRRYKRYAEGGTSLIWLEAIAVSHESRANTKQLFINRKNLDSFKSLAEDIKQTGMKANGWAPLLICQATHSGRYSKPEGVPEPIIAFNHPLFEKDNPIPKDRIATDDYLKAQEEKFGETAWLLQQAGFDGVEVKACHRYLFNELMAAFVREGDYGGSFENRIRIIVNSVKSAQARTSSPFIVTSRVNLYDGFPYPYGFGVPQNGSLNPQLEESVRLVDVLHNTLGLKLLNFTIGNPYVNPHVNRPYDKGGYIPPEHPLEGVARMFHCIGHVTSHFKDLVSVSSAHSYLRHFSPYLAAGAVESGVSCVAGFGRLAFAYPSFPNELKAEGKLDSRKCCVACGKCSQLMRAGSVAGCVVRDTEIYLPLYREKVLGEVK